MTDCGCRVEKTATRAERRTVAIALALNASMFIVGTIGGLVASSSALLADALDMLADASVYALALLAIERSQLFKRRAALASGVLLGILGVSVILESVRRAVMGSAPEGAVMLAIATASLMVNTTVLRMLARYREADVHLRASWIFTRADVVANGGVILAAVLVMVTGSRIPDLLIAVAIGAYVVKEAVEIRSTALRSPGQQPWQ